MTCTNQEIASRLVDAMLTEAERCSDCGAQMDIFGGCPNTPPTEAAIGYRTCGGHRLRHPESCTCETCSWIASLRNEWERGYEC
jgi:hypothetical protein